MNQITHDVKKMFASRPDGIQRIYIMSKDGRVLVEYGIDDCKVDSLLVAGFLSAVHSISSQLDDGGLKCMAFGDMKLTMMEAPARVLVVALHGNKIKQKHIERTLSTLMGEFFTRYPAEIVSCWTGNARMFCEFTETIKQCA